MSLKDKLEGIKKDADTAKKAEDAARHRETIIEVKGKEKPLRERISGLKQLLKELEEGYASSGEAMEGFSGSYEKVSELFKEYEGYLREQGINSMGDILSNEEFSKEEDVVEYNNRRAKLSGKVTSLGDKKKAAKEAMPDLNLDFRGGTPEGKSASPRQESISKIRDYIAELEREELLPLENKKAELKEKIIPQIKEMVESNLDKFFNQPEGYTISSMASNINFISKEVFTICGEEMWPEAKDEAINIIIKKFREKNVQIGTSDIEESLEFEHFLHSVDSLKENYREEIDKNFDNQQIAGVGREINDRVGYRGNGCKIEGMKAYPKSILEMAREMEVKNLEAKKKCDEIKADIVSFLEPLRDRLKPGVLMRSSKKEVMNKAIEAIEDSIKKTRSLSSDDFYGNRYSFSNSLSGCKPDFRISGKQDWLDEITIEVDKKFREGIEIALEMTHKESDILNKLSDDIYHARSASLSSANIGGFEVPCLDIEQEWHYKRLRNKEEADKFFASLDGLSLSPEDLKNKFDESSALFQQELEQKPEAAEAIKRYETLYEGFENKYRFRSEELGTKLRYRQGKFESYEKFDWYELKNEIFG